MAAPPPPPRGLSLYDNLPDPSDTSSSAIISSAPVLYKQSHSGAASSEPSIKKPFQPALQFAHVRRPPVKPPPKPKAAPPPKPATQAVPRASTPPPVSAAQPQKKLADWAATEDDEFRYGFGEKRQRGGRKNKKKKAQEQAETDWDELYDPMRPTNVSEYLKSYELVDEVREWKALLYRHKRGRDSADISEDEEESRPMPSNQFAPPPAYGFVPPPPPSPPAALPSHQTSEDVSAPRAHAFPPPPPATLPPAPPPDTAVAAPPLPSDSDPATISRAPVRYTQQDKPPPDVDDDGSYSPPPALGLDSTDAEPIPRSSRPGQSGFAQRLMSKYGWTHGSGLGTDESGITNALSVKIDKRKKADGGGWAEPAGKGKIIGGKRKQEASSFGTMSEVIVLQNMLENMPDLQTEISEGLGQEIGEECGEKYGRVERLYIDQASRQVFIKFTDQVSALRAVNELKGRIFNGNTTVPKFYDTEKFERGIYT